MTSLPVALLWHHHQPQYRDLSRRDAHGALLAPWVRLHALRDYYGMAAMVVVHPGIHVTFNFSPILLEQLVGYAAGVTDTALELTLTRAEQMNASQRTEITERFFDANWHRQIYPHPRYTQLLRKRLDHQEYDPHDLRDLQMWGSLAWFATELRRAPTMLATGELLDVHRFVKQGQDFSHADIEDMVHEQYKLLRAIVPLHKQLQAAGRIEVSTSPYAHPILPLLIDTDGATLDRPGTTLPMRFRHPEDAEGQLSLGIDEYESLFGVRPRGMWPSEGAVSPDVISLAARHGLSWIATDEGVLQRSGRWGYQTDRVDVRSRAYRAQHAGQQCAVFFRDRDLSNLISFDYHKRSAADATADLVSRLRSSAERLRSADTDPIIMIVLDGENAWGDYPDDGRPFLHALYAELAEVSDLVTVTPSEFLEGNGDRSVARHSIHSLRLVHDLATASWIDEPHSRTGADLGTWIGEPEENQAWEYLSLVRDDLSRVLTSARAGDSIWRALFAAEGSDWFWWFGDDQDSGNDAFFERMFLTHLRSMYSLNALPPPDWLPPRLTTPQRVWEFTRPLERIGVREQLVIVSPCPGLIRWRLDAFAHGEQMTVISSTPRRDSARYVVRLGPFRSDARQLSFSFHCRHAGCDGRGPCCDARSWQVELVPQVDTG